MKTPPSRRPKRALAPPFVTTVSALVLGLGLGGCGSNIETPSTPGTCPAGAVSLGASCSDEGLGCASGTFDCAGFDIGATCQGGVWHENDDISTCNPPPPSCDGPSALGDSCWEPGVTCPWGTDACGNELFLTCADDGVLVSDGLPACACPEVMQGDACSAVGAWCTVGQDDCGQDITASCTTGGYALSTVGSCNPPPPDDCFHWVDEASCNAAGYCNWYVPGCADEPGPNLAAPGCFTAWPCASDADCLEGRTCQDTGFNPCYNDVCEACWSAITLCLP